VRDRLAARLKEVETDLEGLVSAAWARAARAEEAAAASSDPDEVQRALDRLIAGARALHDGGFPGLSNEAWETRERLAGAFAARQARAREVYERLVEDVLKLLREGHMPEEILARIQVARDDEAANASVRAGIDDLALLADGLDSLYRNALEEVRARGRIAPVRLRAGGEEKRWDIVEVHPGERAATVRVQRAGRPGEPQRRGLQELEIGQVAELARGARASLAPLEEAVVLLSDLPERGSGDLRPVLERLRRVQGALKGARREGAFLESVARRVGELAREQEEREAAAHIAYQQADLYVRLKQYPSAHFHLLDLLREDSPRHHTGYVDRNEGRIRALMDVVEGELSDEQLLAHLPGARISSQGNVTSALFDYETPVQLEVFRREGGRGLAVLEPYVPPAAVTPEVKPNTRLHLLRGLDGDLHRHRPLSLQNPFDPAETIEVEFDLFTLTSPFFLAVDVDGVQVGVLSVDPTSPAYAERFRFPEDVPLLEKGEKPPTHDGYGRGRGVAFHAGPDFGDPPGWAWPAGAQGAALGEARTGRDVPGPLFSFEPLTRYRVKVVRQRGKMTLFVDDREIRSEEQAEWATRGRSSDREKGIRGGTGRIQILTWTPQAIDDLRLSGVVMERWR
jgi:hypothetical protein